MKCNGLVVGELTSDSSSLRAKFNDDAPINENGLIQMIRMGKSIRHIWVNAGPWSTGREG